MTTARERCWYCGGAMDVDNGAEWPCCTRCVNAESYTCSFIEPGHCGRCGTATPNPDSDPGVVGGLCDHCRDDLKWNAAQTHKHQMR